MEMTSVAGTWPSTRYKGSFCVFHCDVLQSEKMAFRADTKASPAAVLRQSGPARIFGCFCTSCLGTWGASYVSRAPTFHCCPKHILFRSSKQRLKSASQLWSIFTLQSQSITLLNFHCPVTFKFKCGKSNLP